MNEFWRSEVGPWFERNTIKGLRLPPEEAAALKFTRDTTVSVCLPALNEVDTVGVICETIRGELMDDLRVVDELLVLDSGSEDGTLEAAAAAGAEVYLVDDLLPDLPPGRGIVGKGEALWKSLAVTRGDVVVWIDSDIRNFEASFVTALLHPLLANESIVMSKAFYDRPLDTPDGIEPKGGARVTELGARPLVQLLYPRLAGFIQPLSGEYAVRRDAILELPFVTGYGVDIALLIDVVERFGLDSVVQVDIGTRVHRNRDLAALGRMSFQVMQAILMRLQAAGRLELSDPLSAELTQFLQDELDAPVQIDLEICERPPMSQVLATL